VPRVRVGNRGLDDRGALGELIGEDLGKESLPRREPPIERGHPDSRLPGDRCHGHLQTPRCEQLPGGADDPLAILTGIDA
jgi:hypothetical protein